MAFLLKSMFLVVTSFYSGACTDINDNMTNGVYTFFGDKLLPSFVSLNVTLNGTLLCMNLERNVDMAHDIPVYALSKDNKGLFHTDKVQMDTDKVFAVYIDSSQLAAFRIVHETDKNGKSRMHMEGIVHSKGKLYHVKNTKKIQKTNEEVQQVPKEKLTNRTEKEHTNKEEVFFFQELDLISTAQNDVLYKSVDKPNQHRAVDDTQFPFLRLRQKRQVTQDVNVDVVAVVDFAVYSRWYRQSTPVPSMETREQRTLSDIKQFYALVFNGVNMLYKSISTFSYTIHVRLNSIIVSTNASSSYWTEQYRQRDTPWDKVDADLVLDSFTDWASTYQMKYDHIVLFTGYNMIRTVDYNTSDSIIGIAWIGKVCETDGYSSSLVEDLGGFQPIGTVTHELGHSLSAKHDGTENRCMADDRYIMSPGYSSETEENKLNPWRFSPCSPVYFNDYIALQVRTEQGRECMYGVTSLEDVTPLLPGQVYNATEQCRLRYGSQSYVCPLVSDWNVSNVCSIMYCYNPLGDPNLCYSITSAEGTTCGNKQWCVNGQCVFDNNAPVVDDACILGDDLNPTAFYSQPCSHLLSASSYCSLAYIRERCCQTCANLLTPSFNISTIPSTRTTLITATMHRATTSKPASTAMSQTVTTKPTTTNGPTTTSNKPVTTNMSTTISTKSTTTMPTTISTKSTTTMPTTISTKSTTPMPTTISTKSTTTMSTQTIATKKETIITVGLTTNSTTFSTTPTSDSTRAIIYSNFAGRLGNLTCSRFIVLIAIFVTLNWL